MTTVLIAFMLFSLGFEAGGGAGLQKGFADLEEFKSTITWGGELGIRDVFPGIGLDLGMRYFGLEREETDDSVDYTLRWEGYFFDAAAVFESWPYLEGPVGVKLRSGVTCSPWQMLRDGEVIEIPSSQADGDTLFAQETDWGVLLGGGVMFRPVKFVIIDLGINHRHLFSLDTEKYGETDQDERIMEVYLGARARFR